MGWRSLFSPLILERGYDYYVTQHGLGDVSAFSELKQYYNEAEWKSKREEIFSALANDDRSLKPLFAEERLRERLYELRNKLYHTVTILLDYDILWEFT